MLLLVLSCLSAAPPPAGEGTWGPGPPETLATAADSRPEPRPDPHCNLQVQPAPSFVPNRWNGASNPCPAILRAMSEGQAAGLQMRKRKHSTWVAGPDPPPNGSPGAEAAAWAGRGAGDPSCPSCTPDPVQTRQVTAETTTSDHRPQKTPFCFLAKANLPSNKQPSYDHIAQLLEHFIKITVS